MRSDRMGAQQHVAHVNVDVLFFYSVDRRHSRLLLPQQDKFLHFKNGIKLLKLGQVVLNCSSSLILGRMCMQTKTLIESLPCFINPHSDHSALACFNLITADLGVARQRSCRAVETASWEHPVLNDKNIRHDRWLINHGGTHAVSTGGLHLESTPWAGGRGEHPLRNITLEPVTLFTG